MPVSRPETPTHAGAMIRYRRKRMGMHQSELAQRAGVCCATISRWERGREPIPVLRRERVAEALGLDPARLLEPGPVYLPSEDRRFLECVHALPASEQAALRELVGMRVSAAESAPC